jgi:hypothetical protein
MTIAIIAQRGMPHVFALCSGKLPLSAKRQATQEREKGRGGDKEIG